MKPLCYTFCVGFFILFIASGVVHVVGDVRHAQQLALEAICCFFGSMYFAEAEK